VQIASTIEAVEILSPAAEATGVGAAVGVGAEGEVGPAAEATGADDDGDYEGMLMCCAMVLLCRAVVSCLCLR
jgi:hypothetical protein